jgi:hypothetical protein
MFRPLFVTFLLAAAVHAEIEVVVSPEGPIKTLLAARDAVRVMRQSGSEGKAIIRVKAGRYEITQPLTLEARDSQLQILGDGDAVILGSQRVTGFTVYDGHILKADVSKMITKGVKYRQLFFDDERMTLARWPNVDSTNPLYGGWAFLAEMPTNLPADHAWKSEA